MNREQILKTPSMPAASPSYPAGPYRFINREYLIVAYQSDPEAIRAAVPEPLAPDGSQTVLYEFIRMPDSSGFGDYTESGIVIPCTFKGMPVNFTAQMYLDCEPPIAGGREIWGFPKKHAQPKLTVASDTLTGTLEYAGQMVAMATMGYKHENLLDGHEQALAEKMGKTQINLKIIPDVDGKPAIAQLIAYNLSDVQIKGGWGGPARLHLVPHVNAPVADLPVRRVLGGTHLIADLTLPYGRVLHDYLLPAKIQGVSAMEVGNTLEISRAK
ncbi:MAG TPA: acetoacetate decarboxylase [Gammaproteobacteria bacterium]|nr:acetoacetate decarboxylase [Gammaproteobacteria bacterium]